MSTTEHDPERIPVVIASGQSIERTALTTPAELMELACDVAFADVPALRSRVDRVSVVNVMTRTGLRPASDLAARIGAVHAACEVTTIGGNSPQWLVNRAASAIAGGRLGVTVIAGAEAIAPLADDVPWPRPLPLPGTEPRPAPHPRVLPPTSLPIP